MDIRESSSAAPDRRQAPRTKLVEIAYIGMGPENGGLVLDVSDGGLSFHSVAPVRPSEKIQFLLSLRGHSRIEGSGEVVWTNEMKTICGLKFTSLSSGAREHLNNWTYQSKLSPQARGKKPSFPTTPAQASQATTEAQASPLGPTSAPVFAIRPAYDSPLTVPGDARTPSIWREPLFLWIVFGILGAAIGLSAYKYGIQIGRSETIAPAPAASSPAPQANPEISAPASAPVSSPAATEEIRPVPPEPPSAPRVANSMPAGTFVNASKTEDSSAATGQASGLNEKIPPAVAGRTEQQVQAGQSELAAAQSYLNGTSGTRDSAKAVRLLWAAVGNGNSAAEVLLADLYVRGDSVAKSCEQARILLVAAIKSGNIEAQQKLKDLNACNQ